jgi:hypothetical protein
MKIAAIFIMAMAAASIQAQAIDYTFTVENIQHTAFTLDCPPGETVCVGIPLTITNPAYTGPITITGSFSYDNTPQGTHGSSSSTQNAPLVSGVVAFPQAVQDLIVNVNTDVHTESSRFILFVDETALTPEQIPEEVMPGDSIRTLGLFNNIKTVFSIVFEGKTYNSNSASFFLFEGNDTGFNFFPDAALADIPTGSFSFSSATLPPKLPPMGAEYRSFTLNFRPESVPEGEAEVQYNLQGELVITPVIPEPPEPSVPDPLPVLIDIDPWSPDDEVYTNSDNPIPVGVFSGSMVNGDPVDFDTSKIDPESVRLGIGDAPNIAFPWPLDHNGDYNTDTTYVFKTEDTGIFCGDTEVTLTGETYSGQVFVGASTIDASDCETSFCHPLL